MKKSILLQKIETPNGDTNAYEIISSILEEQANNYRTLACDSQMYSQALSHLNQIMEKN